MVNTQPADSTPAASCSVFCHSRHPLSTLIVVGLRSIDRLELAVLPCQDVLRGGVGLSGFWILGRRIGLGPSIPRFATFGLGRESRSLTTLGHATWEAVDVSAGLLLLWVLVALTGLSVRSPIRARLGSGVVALLVLSGCAGTDATHSVSNDQPHEIEAVVTPRPGMLDVEPVRIWFEWAADRNDPRNMAMTFANQGPPCEVLDHFEVDETDTRVTVTLYHGRDPDADADEPCDGPPDRVFEVVVPLSRDFVFEVDVLINGGSLTDGVDIDTMVTPQPGMVNVEPVPWWYTYGSGDQPHTMLVTFASQGPPCQVLDRVEVDETSAGVTVTLYQGRHPDSDPDEPCDGPTQVVGVQIPLARDYGPAGLWPYSLAGITAETGEGSVSNGGSLTDSP